MILFSRLIIIISCKSVLIMNTIIRIIKGKITDAESDAIVNIILKNFLNKDKLNKKIYQLAGQELVNELKKIENYSIGETLITSSYNLKTKYIIHIVVPIWEGGEKKELEHLANCYRRVFQLAEKKGLKSIVLPIIFIEDDLFPKELLVKVILKEIRSYQSSNLESIFLLTLDQKIFDLIKSLF